MKMHELEKDTKFLDLLTTNMNIQGHRRNITYFQYIAPKLGFANNEYTQLKNMFVPYSLKFLKLDQLFIILNDLDSDLTKNILDYISKKYNFTLSYKATPSIIQYESMKDSLISFSINNGELSNDFFNAIKDDKLTPDEITILKKRIYDFRSALVQFENELNDYD